MKVEDLAALAVSACEEEGVAFMVTGAFACGYCGIPRSTKDVDLVLGVEDRSGIERVIARLAPDVDFGAQVQFDTLTWGRRHVGHAKACPALQVELFELFDDPFVQAQFERRVMRYSGQLNRQTWLPTAEDVVVQKLRWGRTRISTTLAMCLPCKDPRRSTWTTSPAGVKSTAPPPACARRWMASRRCEQCLRPRSGQPQPCAASLASSSASSSCEWICSKTWIPLRLAAAFKRLRIAAAVNPFLPIKSMTSFFASTSLKRNTFGASSITLSWAWPGSSIKLTATY